MLPSLLDSYHSTEKGHHVAVVISPLKALMEEQIKKMKNQGLQAIYLGSSDLTTGNIPFILDIDQMTSLLTLIS